MTNEQAIHQAYELAKERYQELGVDTEEVLAKLAQLSLSIIVGKAMTSTALSTPKLI